MDINLTKMIRIRRGVESYTIDVRNVLFNKRTRESLFTHVIRFYFDQYFRRSYFMDIKLFMDVTDGKYNMFYFGGDLISLDDINSGLDIIKATDRFKKCNANNFYILGEVLFHLC